MSVKILIKRQISRDKLQQLRPLILQLRSMAHAQPGYISGETLRSMDNPEQSLVISTWQSVDDWKAWMNNPDRRAVQEEIDFLTGEETDYEIYLYG